MGALRGSALILHQNAARLHSSLDGDNSWTMAKATTTTAKKKAARATKSPLPTLFPGANPQRDVFFGCGDSFNRLRKGSYYQQLIRQHAYAYKHHDNNKREYVKNYIVEPIHANGGRFYKWVGSGKPGSNKGGCWQDQSNNPKLLFQKIGQALRDHAKKATEAHKLMEEDAPMDACQEKMEGLVRHDGAATLQPPPAADAQHSVVVVVATTTASYQRKNTGALPVGAASATASGAAAAASAFVLSNAADQQVVLSAEQRPAAAAALLKHPVSSAKQKQQSFSEFARPAAPERSVSFSVTKKNAVTTTTTTTTPAGQGSGQEEEERQLSAVTPLRQTTADAFLSFLCPERSTGSAAAAAAAPPPPLPFPRYFQNSTLHPSSNSIMTATNTSFSPPFAPEEEAQPPAPEVDWKSPPLQQLACLKAHVWQLEKVVTIASSDTNTMAWWPTQDLMAAAWHLERAAAAVQPAAAEKPEHSVDVPAMW